MQFSLFRGLALSLLLPLVAVSILAIAHAAMVESSSLTESFRSGFSQIASLYREFSTIAIGLHGILFFNASFYRSRYSSFLPALFSLLFLSVVVWAVGSKLGIVPSSLPQLGAGLFRFTQSQPTPTDSSANPDLSVEAAVPSSTLTLHSVIRPNLLSGDPSLRPAYITVRPDSEGTYTISGYLGSAAVVFAINPNSSITAANDAYIGMSSGPCRPFSYDMNGSIVTGCVATVDEMHVGAIRIGKTRIFFTPSLHRNRVILGGNAMAGLRLVQEPSGLLTVELRR